MDFSFPSAWVAQHAFKPQHFYHFFFEVYAFCSLGQGFAWISTFEFAFLFFKSAIYGVSIVAALVIAKTGQLELHFELVQVAGTHLSDSKFC